MSHRRGFVTWNLETKFYKIQNILKYSEIFWPLCEWRRTPPGIFCPRGPAAPSERSPARPARNWRETSTPASSPSPVSLRSDRSVLNNLRDYKRLIVNSKYYIIIVKNIKYLDKILKFYLPRGSGWQELLAATSGGIDAHLVKTPNISSRNSSSSPLWWW